MAEVVPGLRAPCAERSPISDPLGDVPKGFDSVTQVVRNVHFGGSSSHLDFGSHGVYLYLSLSLSLSLWITCEVTQGLGAALCPGPPL